MASPAADRLAVRAHHVAREVRQRCVAQHAGGRVADHRPEASRGAQHDDRRGTAVGSGERVAEGEDAGGVGPAEGVDRLVGVADDDELGPGRHETGEQPDLRRVGVLVLVDEHRAVAGAQLALHGRLVREQRRTVHDLGVVGDALGVEHVEVLAQELTDGAPRRPELAGVRRERLQVGRVEAERPRLRDDGPHLGGEAAGAERRGEVTRPGEPAVADGVGEQLAQPQLLLRAGEQPQRLQERLGVGLLADQGVAERVEGGDGGDHPAADPGRHAVAPLLRGLAAEGQAENLVRAQRSPVPAGGRPSPRRAWWSCRCRGRRARASGRTGARRHCAGRRRAPGRRPPGAGCGRAGGADACEALHPPRRRPRPRCGTRRR